MCVLRLSQFIWQFIKNTLVTHTLRIPCAPRRHCAHTISSRPCAPVCAISHTRFVVASSHLLPTHKMVLENYYCCYCLCWTKERWHNVFRAHLFQSNIIICMNGMTCNESLGLIWRVWGDEMEQKCTVKLQLTFDSVVQSFRWIQQSNEMTTVVVAVMVHFDNGIAINIPRQ